MNKSNGDVWCRLFDDRKRKDRMIAYLADVKAHQLERECAMRSQTAVKLVQKSRHPDMRILANAHARRHHRMIEQIDAMYPVPSPKILDSSENIVRQSGYLELPVSLRLFRASKQAASPPTEDPRASAPAASPECVEEFLSRQEVYKQARWRRQEILKKWQQEECPFVPAIDPNSDRLACNRRPLGETWQSLHLAKPVKLPAPTNPELTFSPEINPYSEVLAGYKVSAPVFERLYRHSKARRIPSRSTSSTNHSASDIPSQQPPSRLGSKQYSHIRSRYNMSRPDSVLQVAAQQNYMREKRRKQREHELLEKEMEECTFQPNVIVARPSHENQCVPNGLDKFLKQRKQAREKSEERKKLEESYVSLRSSVCSPKRQFELTVPAPFSFS